MLKIGDKAPDITLLDENGKTIQVNQLPGKKMIYFYPKDNTPGCTQQACDFRDHLARFADKGITIIGISRDSAASHQKFRETYSLPFILLIDDQAKISKAYGVLKEKNMFGLKYLGIERSTFLLDEKGIILGIWRKVKVKGHVEKILHESN